MTKNEYTAACSVTCTGLADAIKKHLVKEKRLECMLTDATLKNCETFINDCARKAYHSSRTGGMHIDDAIVYKWARDYFNDGIYLEDATDEEKKLIEERLQKLPRNPEFKIVEVPAKSKNEYQIDLFGGQDA